MPFPSPDVRERVLGVGLTPPYCKKEKQKKANTTLVTEMLREVGRKIKP